MYAADAKQLADAGFHGVKLDDCGDGSGAGLIERVAAGVDRSDSISRDTPARTKPFCVGCSWHSPP